MARNLERFEQDAERLDGLEGSLQEFADERVAFYRSTTGSSSHTVPPWRRFSRIWTTETYRPSEP